MTYSSIAEQMKFDPQKKRMVENWIEHFQTKLAEAEQKRKEEQEEQEANKVKEAADSGKDFEVVAMDVVSEKMIQQTQEPI